MSYDYQTEKPKIFTEKGQKDFLKIRDNVFKHCKESGACGFGAATRDISGDTWFQLACLDRLVELGEVVELKYPTHVWAQFRVFALPFTP